MKITVSMSAYAAWQRCQESYYYSYVRRLRPIVKDTAPERGTLLHEYLAEYYSQISSGSPPQWAHECGQRVVLTHSREIGAAAQAAFLIGDEEKAQEYQDLLTVVLDIAQRYYEARGRHDADRYEVLLVEKSISLRLYVGITSRSIIDLVVRDRASGYIWLVEHKSTKSVPDSAVRLRDFQTMLYARVLEHKGMHVDGILWNYMRTTLPAVPHQNQNGRFSKAIAIDTTWPIYKAAVEAAGQDPAFYDDVRERLEGNETTVWFPRFEHVVVTDAELLLRDYAKEALNMRRARVAWSRGEKPIRTLARDCSFCAYFRICETVITGGDEEDAIRMRFTESPARDEED